MIILVCIGLGRELGAWNTQALNLGNSEVGGGLLFLLGIASFTKSAQVPFSAWLPAAMAAPTPVSSLVHSSTLVTAGVYLLIRLGGLLSLTGAQSLVLVSGRLTMVIAGARALYERDIKKIVALSTLSQLGLIISCVGMGC